MKNQKFEIRIAVGGDDEKVGVNVEMWKDGKSSDFRFSKSSPSLLDCLKAITCDSHTRLLSMRRGSLHDSTLSICTR